MADDTQTLRINMAEVKKDIEYIKDAIDRNAKEHGDMKLLIQEFITSAETKYAPMWTATAVKFVIATVFGSVLVALLSLIVK
jgi:hypothetical protein